MPQPRIPLEPGQMYHIWTHANGSDNLFRCDENYRYFLEKYTAHVYPVAETFAYCLMPNHLHFMVMIREEEELVEVFNSKRPLQGFRTLGGVGVGFGSFVSKQFSNLFNGYAQAYNTRYSRRGSLFIQNFGRKLIDSVSYFTALMAYIHNNPVHHGFVSNPGDWPHSSWHAYINDINNQATRINRDKGLEWFGGINEFLDFHIKLTASNNYPEPI